MPMQTNRIEVFFIGSSPFGSLHFAQIARVPGAPLMTNHINNISQQTVNSKDVFYALTARPGKTRNRLRKA